MAGYFNYSKSNNAVDAEASGIYPLTRAVKVLSEKTGITQKQSRAILLGREPSEYHHTSKYFNSTDYYDTEEIIPIIRKMVEIGITYEDAEELLGDIEHAELEKLIKESEELKTNCIHDMKPVYFKKKERDGGGEYVHHYRCSICGITDIATE